MKGIFKQELRIQGEQELLLKTTDRVIKVAEQEDGLMVWYITDDDIATPLIPRKFYIRGTGHGLGVAYMLGNRYLDTVVMMSPGQRGLVWHVFMQE